MWQIIQVKILILKINQEWYSDINTVTYNITFKVLIQHEAVWMTVISPFKNQMPLLPDIHYLPKVTESTVSVPDF
jgi:hypothetical protein